MAARFWTAEGVIIPLIYITIEYLSGAATFDPCTPTNHRAITDSVLLSRTPESPAGPASDRNIREDWYRIGQQLTGYVTNSCVKKYNCGTIFPIRMNGSLPSPEDGTVDRIYCTVSSTVKTCDDCDPNISINGRVKNCGSFYVFYLRISHSAQSAYCYDYTIQTTGHDYETTTVASSITTSVSDHMHTGALSSDTSAPSNMPDASDSETSHPPGVSSENTNSGSTRGIAVVTSSTPAIKTPQEKPGPEMTSPLKSGKPTFSSAQTLMMRSPTNLPQPTPDPHTGITLYLPISLSALAVAISVIVVFVVLRFRRSVPDSNNRDSQGVHPETEEARDSNSTELTDISEPEYAEVEIVNTCGDDHTYTSLRRPCIDTGDYLEARNVRGTVVLVEKREESEQIRERQASGARDTYTVMRNPGVFPDETENLEDLDEPRGNMVRNRSQSFDIPRNDYFDMSGLSPPSGSAPDIPSAIASFSIGDTF